MELMIYEKGVWRFQKIDEDNSTLQKRQPGRNSTDIGIKSLLTEELEDFHERAAIMEFEGELNREQAEREALQLILAKRNLN